MKKVIALALVLLMMVSLFSACAPKSAPQTTDPTSTPSDQVKTADNTAATTGETAEIPAAIKDKKLKLMLIVETGTGTYLTQYINGVKRMCDSFGIELIVSDAAGSQEKMASYLDVAVNQKVDGILISHGRADTMLPGVKRAIEAGIPVVAKDVDLGLKEVVTIDQDDFMLSLLAIKQMMEDINGEGNVVRAFVGGFVPQERRQKVYEILMSRYTNVKEVATFGSVTSNTSLDAQTKMEAILKQYPNKGDIAAVWCGWEEWAKGASRAIKEAGRSEIKIYSVDMSDELLQMIQEPNSPIKATAAIDPAAGGETQVRILLKMLAGETVPRYYSLTPTLVRQSDLPSKAINISELSEYVPGWGKNNDFWTPWMKAMMKK